MKSRFLRKLTILLFILSVVFFGKGVYMYGKARFAQFLLNWAWDKSLEEGKGVKPWSWADTHPVAKMVVPGRNLSFIVLEGGTGSTLAFGPGHLVGTPIAGDSGNCIIAGHRDTHFNFLKELKAGERIVIQGLDGRKHTYTVTSTFIAHKNEGSAIKNGGGNHQLTLVTCYPFDAVIPGGPLRYVVKASEEEK